MKKTSPNNNFSIKDNKNSLPTMCYTPSLTIAPLLSSISNHEIFVRCIFYLPTCNYNNYLANNNDQMTYILNGGCKNLKELLEELKDIECQVHTSQPTKPGDKPWNKNRINGKLFLQEVANVLEKATQYYDTIFNKYLMNKDQEAIGEFECKINKQFEKYNKYLNSIDSTSDCESHGKRFFKLMLFEAIFSSRIEFYNISKNIVDFLGLKHQPLSKVKISLEDLPYDELFVVSITNNHLTLKDFFNLIDKCDKIIEKNSIQPKFWLPNFVDSAYDYLKTQVDTPIDFDIIEDIYDYFYGIEADSRCLSFEIYIKIWEYIDKELANYISQNTNISQRIRALYSKWGEISPLQT